MSQELGKIIKEVGLEELEKGLNDIKKSQLVKAKNRQTEIYVVDKEDFIKMV